jgi:hypothetical protein
VPADGGQPLPPPQQVNEIQPGANPSAPGQAAANSSANSDSASSSSDAQNDDDANAASSKKKKKKGLHKLVPF